MTDEQADVLIAGGGPTGLVAALLLARDGIDVRLVERNRGTSRWPRATHVTRRTMELLRPAGVEPALRAAGMRVVADVPASRVPDKTILPARVVGAPTLSAIAAADVFDTGAAELAVPGPAPAYWCGQDLLEPILAARGTEEGARLGFGEELADVQRVADGVRALIRTSSGDRVVHARYLIGADGPRSTVRRLAGIGRSGRGLLASRVSILFDADLDDVVRGERFFVCMLTSHDRDTAIMELNDRNSWAVSVAVNGDADEAAAGFTPPRCEELLHAVIGRPVGVRLRRVFGWRVWHNVADSFRDGPVFLAGDAAHVHAPAGGYGSNVGMQDAHNLAWKLAAVLRGQAADGLLDSYEAERRPVAQAMTEQTTLLAGLGEPGAASTPRLPPAALVFGARYQSSAVVGGGPVRGGRDALTGIVDLTGAPGTRMPHLGLRAGGQVVSPHDLCPGTMLVVTDSRAWSDAADALGTRGGVASRGVCVDPRTPGWRAISQGHPGVALLVRPDGVVAWRGPAAAADPQSCLAALISRLLTLPSAAAARQPALADRRATA